MDKTNEVLKYIPFNIRSLFSNLSDYEWKNLNEISFISGQAITILVCGKRLYLGKEGTSFNCEKAVRITKNDIERIFELITDSSVYAFNRFINEGFLTLKGGHRVGLTGNCVCADGKIINVNSINAINFRISHNHKYNYNLIFDEICSNKGIYNSIIISPPGCGKTTLLRGIASYLGGLNKNNIISKCVLIDERYEIAACYDGQATLDVGNVTAVISGCDKSIAIPLVVRSMAPDIIIVDELASEKDIIAVEYAIASGCSVIASTHGNDEKLNRLVYYNYTDLFQKIIILSSKNGPGTVEKIIGANKW